MELAAAVLIVFLVLGPWAFIVALFGTTKRLRSEIGSLRAEIRNARRAQSASGAEPEPSAEVRGPDPKAEASAKEASKAPEQRIASDEERTAAEAAAHDDDAGALWGSASADAAAGGGGEAEAQDSYARTRNLEQNLASRWLIWLGAVAIALAGVFLTAYSIEQGWLGPTPRIVLGLLLGLVLTVAGEWVRRRPFQRAIASVRPDYVPPALSAAGIFTMYTSAYVGNALYALYPPTITLFFLAAIGLGAVALALLQGRFVALVGLIGSFGAPLLVPSDAPSALALFAYLIGVLAAILAVVRYRAWWSLGYCSLLAATVWCLFWLAAAYTASDAAVIGTYILAVCVTFQLARFGYPDSEQTINISTLKGPGWAELRRLHRGELLGWTGFLSAALMLFAFVRTDQYGAIALATLFAFALGSLWAARRNVAFDLTFVLSAGLVVLLFGSWHVAEIAESLNWTWPERPEFGRQTGPIVPPGLRSYTIAAIVFGSVFGVGGFAGLWGARRPSIFAATSAIVPVLLLAIAYWRFLDFEQDLHWAGIALALALVGLLAAGVVEKYRDREPLRDALGLYGAAVVAFLSLALTMTLEEALLTVALSLQLPALAWIHERLRVDLLRAIAAVVAATVLGRLAVNLNVLGYAIEQGELFNWILYGYGVPCLAFFWSARTFARSANDVLVAMLEAGALAFAVLLVSLEIRFWVSGSLNAPYDSLLEQSLQSIAWLTIGCGLLVRGEQIRVSTAPVQTFGAYSLLLFATVQVLVMQVLFNNPLSWPASSVGRWPIVDVLLLAYLVPGCIAFAAASVLNQRSEDRLGVIAGVIGLFLLHVYISLEVKHWFQGEYLTWSFVSDAENYAISVAWLVYALLLLAAGIFLGKTPLRYGSLVILLMTVIKVFIGDMEGLTGLYRVASFLGLGLCLVGIGYIYQRFVFRDTARAGAGAVA